MKYVTTNHKKARIFAAVLATAMALAGGTVGFAKDADPHKQKAKTEANKSTSKETEQKRKEILEEATSAINETHNALRALDKKKTKTALRALERATGKLEIILAREPSLALAPVDVVATTLDTLATADKVKKIRDEAEDLLEDGRVQEARRLLEHLGSETVISTTNIPLATYPKAIKQAAAMVDKDKVEDAKVVLQAALNTLVVTESVIPLPIVRSKSMLEDAEKLAEKSDRKEEENKKLDELLTSVQKEIELAEAFGYGMEKDIESFREEVEKIREKTSDGKSGQGFFSKVKTTIKSIFKDSQEGGAKDSRQS